MPRKALATICTSAAAFTLAACTGAQETADTAMVEDREGTAAATVADARPATGSARADGTYGSDAAYGSAADTATSSMYAREQGADPGYQADQSAEAVARAGERG